MRFNKIASFFRRIYNTLSINHRKKAIIVFFLIMLNSFIDVLGLAFILPVIYLINDSSIIYSNQTLNTIFNFLGFESNISGFISLLMGILLLVFLIKNIVGIFITYYQQKYTNNVAVDLITKQYNRYLHKDFLYFTNTNSNFIVRDIVSIPTDFAYGILTPLINLSTEIFVVLLILIGISLYNLQVLLLISVTLVPVFLIFNKLIQKKIEQYGIEDNELKGTTYKTLFEAIFGIQDVKLYNKESFFINRSKVPISYHYSLFVKLNVLKNSPQRLIEFTAIAGLVLLYFYYSWIAGSDLTELFNTLIVFATAAYRIMPSMSRMMNALMDIRNKNYVFEILNFNEEEEKYLQRISNETSHNAVSFNKEIKLSNISFSYPNQKEGALNNLDLTIQKGSNIGIIGESGCGKTTLLKIICRLLSESNGSLYVDDVKITNKNKLGWTKKIGYVQQDYYLIDSTLAENIAFGEHLNKIDSNKLNNCIKLAQLNDLVNSLPQGTGTNIGEFGSNLSGGQKQRIAIARALYKDSEILIFDEATSALDIQTEHEIIETLKSLPSNKYTTIMIAHKVQSLSFCDIIYKIENGKIYNANT